MPARPKPKSTPEATYTPSTLPEDYVLVRLGAPQGSNQFAASVHGSEKLVDMPPRIRRVSFAARGPKLIAGSFAIVKLYPASETDDRIAGEIVHVVTGGEVKAWRRSGEWPKVFDEAVAAEQASVPPADNGGDDSDCSLPDNPNRRQVVHDSSSEESSDEEE